MSANHVLGRLFCALVASLGLLAAAPATAGAEGTQPATPSDLAAARAPTAQGSICQATPSDALGPFYVPNAPMRTAVGEGYVLSGVVRAVNDCEPIPGARIELWLANPQGQYDAAHRATMLAESQGEYRFESNVPVPYGGRPPHIHIRVTAPGFRTLVTQHYPADGQTEGTFDLVLMRA